MDDEDFDEEPDMTWTDPARAALREATERLTDAVRVHADILTRLEGRETDTGTVFHANDQLAEAAVAYANAQFDLTYMSSPFGIIGVNDEDEPGDEDDDLGSDNVAISILSRTDYIVQDLQAVMDAGRSAYLHTRGEKVTPEDAKFSVSELGAALYEITHKADTWEVLRDTAGIEPISGRTWIVPTDTPLIGEPDEDLFSAPEGGWQTLFGHRGQSGQ